MGRIAARIYIIVLLAFCSAGAYSQTSDEVLARAEARVHQIDSVNLTISGSFTQRVKAIYSLGDQAGSAEKTYKIVVTNGIQDSRTPVPATDTASMPIRNAPRSTTVFALRDVLLPYKAVLEKATGDPSFHSEFDKDSSIGGTMCYTIYFEYSADMDSSHVHGGGRLWISKTDYTPILSSYDFDGSNITRGKFVSGVMAKVLPVNQTAVIGENTTHISFTDGKDDLGGETTKVRNSDFEIK
jgi:hypothetical protein